MSENKKRNIYILTDDPKLVYTHYVKLFNRAEFANQVIVEDMGNLSTSVLEMIKKSNNTILFLTKTADYINDLFLNTAIINMVENQDIDYIVANSVVNWRKIESAFDEANPDDKRKKEWIEGRNIFDWFHIMPLIDILQENSVPENIIYAFISDNDKFIDMLFDNLLKAIGDRTDDGNGGGGDGPINSKKHLPLTWRLPRIFMGWIWRIWYAPIRSDRKHFDSDVEEEKDDDVVGYIRRSVILNLGDKSITYVHIKPNTLLDLSEVVNNFAAVYFDLNTYYGSLVFCEDQIYPSFEFIPFTSKSPYKDYSKDEWLNVFRNYMYVTDALGGDYDKKFKVRYKYNNANPELDKVTHTVTTIDTKFKIPYVYKIESILPPPRPEFPADDDDDN